RGNRIPSLGELADRSTPWHSGGVSSRFPTTRWTLIRQLKDNGERARALEFVVETYRDPLYHYARRSGLDDPAAEDALQQFMVVMLERDFIDRIRADRGHLRGFLKTAFRNFLANQFEKRRAAKRGGGVTAVSFDAADELVASRDLSPDGAFDRAWAETIMNRAFQRLCDETADPARVELLERYFGSEEIESYESLGKEFSLSAAAVKAFLHRARGRFHRHLEDIVADTSDDPGQEMDALREILGAI
ncbi:MAG: sigma-70 family RNA polymerase sigma factor, partial [Myxococcota bacterium]